MVNQGTWLLERHKDCVIEVDLLDWHYWVCFYADRGWPQESDLPYGLHGVFADRKSPDPAHVHVIDESSFIPGEWLRHNGGTLYRYLVQAVIAEHGDWQENADAYQEKFCEMTRWMADKGVYVSVYMDDIGKNVQRIDVMHHPDIPGETMGKILRYFEERGEAELVHLTPNGDMDDYLASLAREWAHAVLGIDFGNMGIDWATPQTRAAYVVSDRMIYTNDPQANLASFGVEDPRDWMCELSTQFALAPQVSRVVLDNCTKILTTIRGHSNDLAAHFSDNETLAKPHVADAKACQMCLDSIAELRSESDRVHLREIEAMETLAIEARRKLGEEELNSLT